MVETKISIFQGKKVRKVYFQNEWYFSVVDIISVLTNSSSPNVYWSVMKSRQKDGDGNQLFTICKQLKFKSSDGKMYETDCSNMEGILRIIQSIPSPKAEPFKVWLAKVGKERIDEIQNPELAMVRMKQLYQSKGYSPEWIEKRARGIAVRNELTDEWRDRGIQNSLEFAILTNEIMQGTFDMKVGDYKKFKGLKKENLRDHMDDMELIFTMLGEATTTKLTTDKNSKGYDQLKSDAHQAGVATGKARKNIEDTINKKVVSSNNNLKKQIK